MTLRQPFILRYGVLLFSLLLSSTAIGQINANFTTLGSASGCAPLQVTFQDQTTGGNSSNYTYSWNFGIGTSALQNPTATYTTPGTYTVTLTVSDGSGSDVETKTGFVTVYNNPSVNFTASPLAGCPPLLVTFTDQTNNNASGASTYNWYFGGPTSSAKNPTHTYTTSGQKTITLTVTNSNGCSSSITKTNYINVYAPPSVNFNATQTDFCSSPATTNFTSTVSGGTPNYTYNWSFGSGAANPSNISFSGTPPTAFNVGLTVTDANGCQTAVTKNNYINIHDPQANFTAPTSGCAGSPISFINTSSPTPTGTIWDFDDNTSSTSTSVAHTYGSAGVYNVKLITDYNGCKDTIVKPITIHPRPNVDFRRVPDTLCPAPQTVQFFPKGTGYTSVFWDFGVVPSATSTSINPSYTYTQNGKYSVTFKALDNNGCSDSLTKIDSVQLYDLHAIGLHDLDSGCVPLTVKFYGFAHQADDTSSDVYPYPVTEWHWDFGHNSATSNLKNPTYTYTDTGVFRVVLRIKTIQGCYAYDTSYIQVGRKPIANFSAVPTVVCPNKDVIFTNLSIGDTLTGFKWSFGDNSVAFSKDATKAYFRPGKYSVMLEVYSRGCKDSIIKIDYIEVLPGAAAFATKHSCDTPLKISFFDSSLGATRFKWIFGDGVIDTVNRNPVHIYPAYGSYTVMFIVSNDTSLCVDTFTRTLNLVLPQIDFVANDTTICEGDAVTFTASVTGATATTGYSWFVNGTLVQLYGTTNTYSYNNFKEGYNTVLVSIVDENQCERTKERVNYIFESNPKLKFGATPLQGCVPVNVHFKDSSKTTSPANIVSWQWDFGDGVRSGVNAYDTVSHYYSQRGPFNTKVIVVDNIGCKDSLEIAQLVKPHKPIANFSVPGPYCLEDTAKFSDNSTNAVSYKWYFGDGDSSTLADPWHVYPQVGAYTPRLVVEDSIGCKDTFVATTPVTFQKPTARITMSDSVAVCPPLVVNFDATSSINATSYEWDLGTGNNSFLSKPKEIYVNRQSYKVTLIAKDALGCRDTIERNIKILGYNGSFSYTPLTGCKPLKVDFDALVGNVAKVIWDFGDGAGANGTSVTASHTYTTMGKYVPKVIFEDAKGCKAASTGADTITVDGVIADIGANGPCENSPVQFDDSSYSPYSATTAWSWKFQGGQTSAKRNPIIYFGPAGKYTVSLKVTNANGCVDSTTEEITIYPPPVVSAGPDTIICLTDSATLYPSGALTYLWSPNINLSCTNCTNPKAAPSTKTYYTVIGTDGNGCKDTAQTLVDIKTEVTSTITGGGEICEGDSIILIVSGAKTYLWSPSESLDDPRSGNPVSRAVKTTNYMVVAFEGSCIPDTNFVMVTVHPKPDIEAKGEQSIVAGTSADLLATGTNINRLVWSPSSSLNCSDCSAPTARPYETTRYVVIAYSDYGCQDSAFVTVKVLCDEKQLFLPNTFTPNGDGQNDVFYPRGAGIEKIVSFKIFNRWGEVVFERTNFSPNDRSYAWDGTYKGTVLPPDTYVYFVQAYCEGDELLKVKGDITIIR